MKEIVKLQGVQKNFGKFQALKDVTFTVERGQVVSFIGPNGAGKSTTIRILLGILKRSGGEAKIFGRMFGRIGWKFISGFPMCQEMLFFGKT